MSTTRGIIVGTLASLGFGTSGAFLKPLLESGWSPAAAVTVRAGVAGLVLLPFALASLRGNWGSVIRGRWRILGMATAGVAATQLVYFAAVQRLPVSTALLIEYLAPLLLVGLAWVTTRRMPRVVVLIGSVVAIGGLVLVIGPGSIVATDGLGVFFAALAAIGCAAYYVIAARPADGLPSVALAGFGLVLGSALLGLVGAIGLVPFTANFGSIDFLGAERPWWLPMGIVALVGTAFAYVFSIAASGMLGSRLMSFVGLLEVVFASIFAWLLLGEALTLTQLLGGILILAGIAFVRSEKAARAELEPGAAPATAPASAAPVSTLPAATAPASTLPASTLPASTQPDSTHPTAPDLHEPGAQSPASAPV